MWGLEPTNGVLNNGDLFVKWKIIKTFKKNYEKSNKSLKIQKNRQQSQID